MSGTRGPEFRWIEGGAGEPVLFLHGLLGDMNDWEGVLEALAPVCRPLALSLPILDPGLADPSLDGLSGHVLRFLDLVDAPRAVLAGNSLGGHVALRVALEHPRRVAGLVLAGSSGLLERGLPHWVPRVPSAAWVRARMEEVVHDPALVSEAWVERVRRTVTTRVTARRVLGFARAARRDDLGTRLAEVRIPTLIVWGTEDRITPLEVGRRFHALIADSQLWTLTRCGHAPMLEQPQAFGAVLREWLDDTWIRRAQLTLAGSAR